MLPCPHTMLACLRRRKPASAQQGSLVAADRPEVRGGGNLGIIEPASEPRTSGCWERRLSSPPVRQLPSSSPGVYISKITAKRCCASPSYPVTASKEKRLPSLIVCVCVLGGQWQSRAVSVADAANSVGGAAPLFTLVHIGLPWTHLSFPAATEQLGHCHFLKPAGTQFSFGLW